MPANRALKDLLDQYKKGELSAEAAAEAIDGLRLDRIGDFACMDLGRNVRCGMPEVVLAEGKDPTHLASIAIRHAQAAGRCIITRINRKEIGPIRESADQMGI